MIYLVVSLKKLYYIYAFIPVHSQDGVTLRREYYPIKKTPKVFLAEGVVISSP